MVNSGTWQSLSDGGQLWRLRIISPGAYSINLIYSELWMPPGAKFFLYNVNHSMVIGAFTESNNKEYGKFATTLVEGNVIILEYYEPAGTSSPGIITISKVIHAYRNFFGPYESGHCLGFGCSSSCNVDVNCFQGWPWDDQKKSVALVLLQDNSRRCSGALVNNVKLDEKPYFLTAFHCADADRNGTLSTSEKMDAEDWIFMFNYESPTCYWIDGDTTDTVVGATFRAGKTNSDFLLMEISLRPPEDYNVYYSGWSRSTTAANSVVGIHHPRGDIKKICLDNEPPISSGNFWFVDNWDEGTTEGGSSGSPLFDPDHRIVGQDYAGDGYPGCDPEKGTYYGKFSKSWNLGTSSSTRLKDWLDPNSTNPQILDGMNGGPPSAPVLSLSGSPGDYPTLSWVDGGEPDLNHFVLKKKYTNITGTMTYYINPAPNPYTDTGIIIQRRGGGTLAEYWVKSVDEAAQESPYSNKKSVSGLGPAWKQVGSEQTIPEKYGLAGNFPNPFNPNTTIKYDLPERSRVTMVIYDILGRTVRTLIQNTMDPGFHEIRWDGKDDKGNPVSTGMYIYRFSAFSEESEKQFNKSNKLVLMK